ncbi:very-long-chain 3-ketoacyl-CoA synthase, Thiolase-like protein [Artemisia annua]|uniref:3-ketoacyl-CoA synthase n=1 Tax=Artemisia annua TaxID=35608 RepID=A0A2U1P0Z4_ARTAN|nr:very-long-chain 3-ketoacyl-CoA synthase, Thiolase-like protein [Artemisia annua]
MTKKTSCKVYLIDFVCYKPPSFQKCPKELTVIQVRQTGVSEELLDFMKRVLERSGLGDSTYLAEIYFKQGPKGYNPSMKDSRREVELAIFGSVDMLLAKTGVKKEDIGILIVNCCIYNTQPSLSSIIVNRYKFKENIITYNLAGMGCSAGLLAIGLAKQLLQKKGTKTIIKPCIVFYNNVHMWALALYICLAFNGAYVVLSSLDDGELPQKVHKNSYALIVSTESITENCYTGKHRSKFLINCLFRVGGAAILLSNRSSDRRTSKYELQHTVHTNTSSSDLSYNCILREEDNAGIVGVTINKDLLKAAVATIRPNVATVGHLILPIREKLIYVINYIARKIIPKVNLQPYIPDYSKAVDHFLPHVGGRPVLDELQKTLGFSDDDMEASRMTLYRYGNTSSSSIWYELAYVEAKGRVKKGDRVWQIAFGSGFKCQSVICRAMKSIDHDDSNPWTDEIHGFPVNLGDMEPFPVFFESSK